MEQQEGRSQFGVPPSEMTPFSSPGVAPRAHLLTTDPLHHQQQQQQQQAQPPLAEAASPINSRPPPPMGFNELAPAVGTANFPVDDDALAAAAGEEAERGGSTANRWPRQETLALLKIRSDMDATFRDATLKGPLWEDVSRKLAELGYQRSAKKCKEKFENVHKYYKRTKEGRAGRQDGKSYRFFSELEALHSGGAAAAGSAPALSAASAPVPISFSAPMAAGQSFSRMQPTPISSVPPPPISTAAQTNLIGGPHGITGSAAGAVGLSLSDNSSSSSFESDDEGTEGAGGSQDDGGRKRKRGAGGGTRSGRKMMTFFEGLMRQVMERQEAMQQRFLDTIEKREQDRMIREEAWRRQELVRLNHEKELLAQERSMAANRDNALISYLQKITGKTIPMPTVGNISVVTTIAPQTPHVPPPPLQGQQRPQPSHQQNAQQMAPITVQPLQQHPPAPSQPKQQNHEAQRNHHDADIVRHPQSATELIGGAESQDAGGMVSFEPMSPSSRWPKAEVHALISIRSRLDSRYQEAGPKGPLWEEISAGMKSLGYSRSAKRCKEKWENINKYFKKVKESNKKRPEDAKTCPYFHQLDALYRKKHVNDNAGAGNGSSSGTNTVGLPQQGQEPNPSTSVQKEQAPEQTQQLSPLEGEKNGNHGGAGSRNSESGGVQALNSNGGLPSSSSFEEGMKKNVMDDYVDKLDDDDSDNMEQDDDCDDDDDEDDDETRKMQYKIQFQRPNVNGAGGGSGSNSSSTAAAAAAGSFMAMVK